MEMFLFPSCFFLTLLFLHLHFFVMSSFRFPIPCAFHLPQLLFSLFIVCMVFVSPFLLLLDVGSCRLSPRCHTLPRCSFPSSLCIFLFFIVLLGFLLLSLLLALSNSDSISTSFGYSCLFFLWVFWLLFSCDTTICCSFCIAVCEHYISIFPAFTIFLGFTRLNRVYLATFRPKS